MTEDKKIIVSDQKIQYLTKNKKQMDKTNNRQFLRNRRYTFSV